MDSHERGEGDKGFGKWVYTVQHGAAMREVREIKDLVSVYKRCNMDSHERW